LPDPNKILQGAERRKPEVEASCVPQLRKPIRITRGFCISFDVDNESYLLARGETSPTTLSAADFGAETGLPRILELLGRHRIPASFFIPAVSALLHAEMIPAILKSGRHEIRVHGWIHKYLPALSGEAEEERLLHQAMDYLTKVTGKRPVGSGAYDQGSMFALTLHPHVSGQLALLHHLDQLLS